MCKYIINKCNCKKQHVCPSTRGCTYANNVVFTKDKTELICDFNGSKFNINRQQIKKFREIWKQLDTQRGLKISQGNFLEIVTKMFLEHMGKNFTAKHWLKFLDEFLDEMDKKSKKKSLKQIKREVENVIEEIVKEAAEAAKEVVEKAEKAAKERTGKIVKEVMGKNEKTENVENETLKKCLEKYCEKRKKTEKAAKKLWERLR